MASSLSAGDGVAAPYATALFELALESSRFDEVEADLGVLSELLEASEDLRRMVRSPLFSRAEQAEALAAVARAAGLGDLSRKFLGLLAHSRRLTVVHGVIRQFDELLARHRGITRVEVEVARPLDPNQEGALRSALEEATGGGIQLRIREEPALLGGLVVRVGSRMVDASLRSRLERMRIAMRETR